ncbi:cellulose synthase (UDP-forming) [Clostridium sp. DSM 8431]|uniref:glycosyltransferase n=1 Tax=Clostridium sp. DSM 8431 TaxID=1761781 RepID=UPI0008EDD5D9|nr:glycosyltransferase [Clostridium sp. DSM 8431]SFU83980.1 cellulose synthase (UDP-forming) [Clostridium sp. DSM 8431]
MNAKKLKNKLLIIMTVLSTIIYLLWRIFFTLPFGEGKFAFTWGVMLLAVEVLGMIEAIIHFRSKSSIEYPERPNISDDMFVDVDVFIATYNEPYELLYKTVNGCVNMDYPDKSKVHIYICDDSDRPEMKELAKKFNVNYITRTERKGAKAGNFNNALKHTKSPLIVTFDADMIPMHDFLTATVLYFYLNEKVGFIQTPQSFYNPDLFQFNLFSEGRIPNEQDYFYRDIQVSRNKTNSVIYGGSNTIISRKALEEAGGFYTESITEDFATGMNIQSLGYRCYAINEVHASGLSPSDLKTLIKQRDRWARGCIQAGRKLNILFKKGLTLSQRFSYIAAITYWYSCIKRFIYIMSPILFSVFDLTIVKCNLLQTLIFWLPMYILNRMALKKLSNNIRSIKWTNVYETILFPSLIPSVILETLCISKKVFSVTKKDGADDDRSYRIRASMPHIILAVLSFIGIGRCISFIFETGTIGVSVVLFWLTFNLYTILMSIFFMLGRQAFRSSERFYVEDDCIVSDGKMQIKCRTNDVSENGVSIILDEPEYIDYKKNMKISIKTERYSTEFKAAIVQV